METEENKENETNNKETEATEINGGGDSVEDDDSNLVDFQRVPTQLLKSDILNSTKDNFEKKVFEVYSIAI